MELRRWLAQLIAGSRYDVVDSNESTSLRYKADCYNAMRESVERPGGILAQMMARQRELYDLNGMPNIDYGRPLGRRAKRVIIEGIGDFVKSCMHECAELENWTPWKPWSQQLGNKSKIEQWGHEHIREMRMEVVDIMCFAFNLCHLLGMDWQTLWEMFNAKMDVNINERHNSGKY